MGLKSKIRAMVFLIPWAYRKAGRRLRVFGAALILLIGLTAVFSHAGGEITLLPKDQQEVGGLPKGWQALTFPKISRHTQYRLIHEGERSVIRAESRQSASGMYRPLDLNPKEYTTLSWCWKIDRVINKGDETKKGGDDYAARIYVTFKYDPSHATFLERTKLGAIKMFYGEYPPKGALNYVWAGHLPIGKRFSNPYTDRSKMVVVESGNAKATRWVCEARNLYDDYKQLFGEEPPTLYGIAVMTDTDNTGDEAIAYYADLVLHAERKEKNR